MIQSAPRVFCDEAPMLVLDPDDIASAGSGRMHCGDIPAAVGAVRPYWMPIRYRTHPLITADVGPSRAARPV